MATFDRLHKPDTHGLFINAGGGATDLAQNKAWGYSNLANNTTYLTQGPSQLAIRSPREISLVANLSNTQTGLIVNYGSSDGASYIYRVSVSGGSVSFAQNSAAVITVIGLPGITGTASAYVLSWSTDYDPIAGTYFSEFALCRIATGGWTISRVTHAEPSAAGMGWQFNLLGYGAGNSLFSGGVSNITGVRVSKRFHSTIEAREDWQTESSAPSPTGFVPALELAPTSVDFYEVDANDDVADAILDSESFAGPAEWLAALHAGTSRTRLFSPLLNLELNTPPTLQNTWLPANFYTQGFAGFYFGINYLFSCPVPIPPGAGGVSARVRVMAQSWVAAGAPMGTTALLVMIMRTADGPASGQAEYTTSVQCTNNHGSGGMGEWLDLGELPLLMDAEGITYLTLGLSFATGTGNTFRRAKIKAIAVDCYVKDGG